MLSTHWLCCVMWDVSNTRWGIQFNVIFPSYRSCCWASGEAHSAIKMLIISNICGSMIMKWNNRHSECYFYFLQFYNLILFPHFIFADESAPLVGVWYAILELFICFNDRGINFCTTFRFVCSNVFAHFARICLIKRRPLEFVCTFSLIFLRLLLLPSYFRSVECSHSPVLMCGKFWFFLIAFQLSRDFEFYFWGSLNIFHSCFFFWRVSDFVCCLIGFQREMLCEIMIIS